ncbi:MAG: HD domain-containing protein [Candidatus Jettenia sp.]|nr:MAG: HD domain-containing protein [Candidatus Jettenia sp.]
MKFKNNPPIDYIKEKKVNEVIKIYFEFNHLKQLYRQGWLLKNIPEEKCESVADHIYGVTMLSFVVAHEFFPELDITKIIKIALIHDLGEAHVGDLTPHDQIHPHKKEKDEYEAIAQILSKLSTGKMYLNLWNEFRNQSSLESKFVKQMDRLEMALQASVYENLGYGNMQNFFDHVQKKLSDEELKNIFKDIGYIRRRSSGIDFKMPE